MNLMQLIQMLKGGGNPQQMLMGMLNQQAGNNPMMKNVFDMVQKNDASGVEQFARNLAKEKGIDADQAVSQLKQQFGMN